MGCCGKHRKATGAGADNAATKRAWILPTDQCALCAEKHVSTAYALSLEIGYETPNRQRIIGELTAAALHLCHDNAGLAGRVRDLRHAVQERKAEIEWLQVLAYIDTLATAEANKQENDT